MLLTTCNNLVCNCVPIAIDKLKLSGVHVTVSLLILFNDQGCDIYFPVKFSYFYGCNKEQQQYYQKNSINNYNYRNKTIPQTHLFCQIGGRMTRFWCATIWHWRHKCYGLAAWNTRQWWRRHSGYWCNGSRATTTGKWCRDILWSCASCQNWLFFGGKQWGRFVINRKLHCCDLSGISGHWNFLKCRCHRHGGFSNTRCWLCRWFEDSWRPASCLSGSYRHFWCNNLNSWKAILQSANK